MNEKNYHHKCIILIWLFAASLIAGCSSSDSDQGNLAEPLKTPRYTITNLPPEDSPTTIPPSITPTAMPTSTETQVPTQTSTATDIPPTATFTEEPLFASTYAGTVCRTGPGTVYPVLVSILENGTAMIKGKLQDQTWYLIEFAQTGETCWIFNEIIELNGDDVSTLIMTPPPSPTPAPAPTQSEEQKKLGVKYFLIIPDNGGPFACGDGMAYFYSGKSGKDTEGDITAALNALFSVKSEYVGNYYNPVFRSNLRVKDVELNNGNTTIRLGGNFVKPKSECEAKRIHLQVWKTASQFSEVRNRPIIWVNNVLLGDLLEHIKE
jgi:hypothetical protein